MTNPLTVTGEPLDDGRYRFVVDRALLPGRLHRFTSAADARELPVAEAVLGVSGVSEVVVSENILTVTKRDGAEWCDLEEPLRYAIAATSGAPPPEPAAAATSDLDDDAMFDLVTQIFQHEVNPAVAQHGGAVDLIDVQDGTVMVRMRGGCQGCGMANVTLRQGIEGSLRRAIPALRGVEDITDHSQGTNPYFASQKQ